MGAAMTLVTARHRARWASRRQGRTAAVRDGATGGIVDDYAAREPPALPR